MEAGVQQNAPATEKKSNVDELPTQSEAALSPPPDIAVIVVCISHMLGSSLILVHDWFTSSSATIYGL